MVILGLDPGTAATGFGLVRVEGSRMRAVDFGCVQTDAHTPAEERLAAIARVVDGLLAEHEPAVVAIEDVYVGGNPRTALAVGQARGALLVLSGLRGIPVAEYSVSAIKTAVCGYGRADKRQVQRMVASILGLAAMPTPDHAADALAAAICHAGRHGLDRSRAKAEARR